MSDNTPIDRKVLPDQERAGTNVNVPLLNVSMLAVSAVERHPLSEKIPHMAGAQWESFKASVKAAGKVLDPIEVLDGKIIDGRHRHRACLELGITHIPAVKYVGSNEDVFNVMLRKAVMRRHLTEDQRALLAAQILKGKTDASKTARAKKAANARHSASESAAVPETGTKPEPKRAREEVAESLNASQHKVRQAQLVQAASPEIAAKVESGEMTLREGVKAVKGSSDSGLDWTTKALHALAKDDDEHIAASIRKVLGETRASAVARLILKEPPSSSEDSNA